MTIGDRIKELRLKHPAHPSQTEIGRLIASTDFSAQSKIKRIEAGKQEPTVSEVFALADYFGVDRVWLLTGGEQKHTPSPPEPDHPPPVARDDLLLRSLMSAIDQLSARITDLSDRMNAQGTRLEQLHQKIDDTRNRMNEAAESQDISRLKRMNGTG